MSELSALPSVTTRSAVQSHELPANEQGAVEEAISGLSSFLDGASGVGPGVPPKVESRLRAAMALFEALDDAAAPVEQLKEDLRASESPALSQLAEDEGFLKTLDAFGAGDAENGVISKEAVGDYLQSANRAVRELLDGEFTEGDYENLTRLFAKDPDLGDSLLTSLSPEQREDLAEHIGADPALVAEPDTLSLQSWAYDFKEAQKMAGDLATADPSQAESIAHILYGSLTGADYGNLKTIAGKDPALGKQILEASAPLQEQLAERIASDPEMGQEPASWSDGYRELLGLVLPESRRSLLAPITPEQADERLASMWEDLENVGHAIEELTEIALNSAQYAQEHQLPPEPIEGELGAQAYQLMLQLGDLQEAAQQALDSLGEAIQGAGDGGQRELLQPFYRAVAAMQDLQSVMDGPVAELMNQIQALLPPERPATPENVEGERPVDDPERPERPDADGPERPSTPDISEASGSGLQHVTWSPGSEHPAVAFAVSDPDDLMEDLAQNAQFQAWAQAEWPGWELMSVAMMMAHVLFPGPPRM